MISFLKRLNEKRFLATHKFFARFNIAWGGADACIRAGCEKYCGHNLNENLFFYLHRDFKKRMEEHESRAKSILEDVVYKFEGDNQMTQNEKLRNQAVEMLKDLDLTGVESVQINNTKFDDGSTLFEIGVSYPAEVIKEVESKE